MTVGDGMMAWLETVRGKYYVVGTPPDILWMSSITASVFLVNMCIRVYYIPRTLSTSV